jgi:hypothetical protein
MGERYRQNYNKKEKKEKYRNGEKLTWMCVNYVVNNT